MIKKFLSVGTGLGLVFGAAAGAVLFVFTNEIWYVIAGTAVGLIIGAIISAGSSK